MLVKINNRKVLKQLTMYKLIITPLLALTIYQTTAQIAINESPTSLKNLYYAIDTLPSTNKSYFTVNLKWMDSIIQIRKTTSLRYDLEEDRKFRRDPTFNPTSDDTLRHTEMRKTSSQNCHSYALEKYFKNIGVRDELFTGNTVLTENKYMEQILFTSFEKTKEFKTKKKKCNDCLFDKGTILVFRNGSGSPIHTVYFDGRFHSKYGGWSAKGEDNINIVLKTYWDTLTIEEYKFDQKKVARFFQKKKA